MLPYLPVQITTKRIEDRLNFPRNLIRQDTRSSNFSRKVWKQDSPLISRQKETRGSATRPNRAFDAKKKKAEWHLPQNRNPALLYDLIAPVRIPVFQSM